MPTVFRHGPYRFYFYSHDSGEPAHVHVDRDRCAAKFWLDPVSCARNEGFAGPELRRLERLVRTRRTELIGAWFDYFGE